MEFGNVYEVFEPGDLVKINNIRHIHDGRTGTIIGIQYTGPDTIPSYNVRLDPTAFDVGRDVKDFDLWVDARSLTHRFPEKTEIAMWLRSCKTLYQGLKKLQDGQSEYTKELLNKLIGGTDEMKNVDVKKIIFSGPKTIVFWNDGTKTIVSMSKDEAKFDPEAAFCAAYTKKMFGVNSKIKRIIKEKSNYEEWKEKEEPENQLYRLGLKALAGCEDVDLTAIESWAKEAKKFQDQLVQMMYETLTGHPYEGEKDNDEN